MTTISQPVGTGPKSRNLPDDVRAVQELFNRIARDKGGPSVPLKVDGICGPKTNNAIQVFQQKQFGWAGADGRVDPAGQTLVQMNQLATPTGPTGPTGPVKVMGVAVSQGSTKPFVDNDFTDFFFRFGDPITGQAALYCFRPEPGGMPLYFPKFFSPRGDLFATLVPVDIRELGGPATYSTFYEGSAAQLSALGIQGSYGYRSLIVFSHLPRGMADKYHGWDAMYGRNKEPNKEEIRGRIVFHSMVGEVQAT
jgi:hypothetical protein